ncbi:cysteine--tRNA ligase, partial [Candidatus Woesearchaeota archaeon]|nr:cysteine--tRNA ligase [Candidatus Woesearchaeota archaeon]
AMDNDLEISESLAAIFVFIKHVNVLLRSKKVGVNDAKKIKDVMLEFDKVLGVIKKNEDTIPEEIQSLVDERDAARAVKNFARSDEIREELQKQGFVLEDTPEGTRVKKTV